ncbi:MAG TPA: DUF5693 family protein [Candidatus Eremiobacteraceae bacterium]|nr:DUF5693 family protein [Candidatus Eremiobacteraceae bacterium]
MRMSMLRRIAVALIALGLVASLLVAFDRWRYEAQNKSVEVTIDQQDLSDFAHAYGYDLDELLREMRRAGLTSVAAYEELGQRVNDGGRAFVQSGAQIVNAARDASLADPMLANMVRNRTIDPASVYVLVYDPATLKRYLTALGIQFEPSTVHVLRARIPALIAVKTQLNFFNSVGLGIPQDFADRVRRLGLLVDPRVQNNERLGPAQIGSIFDQMMQGGEVGTVIFFGQLNEVLGYPYQLDATANALKLAHINFGDVEAYSDDQIQKGTQTLGTDIPNQTVRVQAIAQPLLQKMQLDDVVGTYILGVRERNIRVIYLRTFPHVIQAPGPDGTLTTLSAEQTNLVMLRELRDRLQANGFHEGRPEGFVDFKGGKLPVLWFLAILGTAAAFVLLLDLLGWARDWMAWGLYALSAVAYWGAWLVHHDEFVRKAGALGAALTFAVLAGVSLARWFAQNDSRSRASNARPNESADRPLIATVGEGGVALVTAVAIAVAGAAFVTALLAQATFMLEINQFAGVKTLLVVPPLALLLIYAFTPMFGARIKFGDATTAPVRVWQLAALFVLAAAAVTLILRSGNQPDIGVSGFETQLRGLLAQLLGARPRFKEFAIGYPLIVLLPAVGGQARRYVGWLVMLCAGIGLADVLDTFSHLHTPLHVGLLRTFNGVVLGFVIGVVLQVIYRSFTARRPAVARAEQ